MNLEYQKHYSTLIESLNDKSIQNDLMNLKNNTTNIYTYLLSLNDKTLDKKDSTIIDNLWLMIIEMSFDIKDKSKIDYTEMYNEMLKKLKSKHVNIFDKFLELKLYKYLDYSDDFINGKANNIISNISEATQENAIIMDMLLKIVPDNIKLLIKVSMYTYYFYNNLEGACYLLDKAITINPNLSDIYVCYSEILENEIKKLKTENSEDKNEIINGHSFHLNEIYNKLINICKDYESNELFKKICFKQFENMKLLFKKCELKKICFENIENNRYIKHKTTYKLIYCLAIDFCNLSSEMSIKNRLQINKILASININSLDENELQKYNYLKSKSSIQEKYFKSK